MRGKVPREFTAESKGKLVCIKYYDSPKRIEIASRNGAGTVCAIFLRVCDKKGRDLKECAILNISDGALALKSIHGMFISGEGYL